MTEPKLKQETEIKPELRVSPEATLVDSDAQTGSITEAGWVSFMTTPSETAANPPMLANPPKRRSPTRPGAKAQSAAATPPAPPQTPMAKLLKLTMFGALSFLSCCLIYIPYLLSSCKAEVPIIPNPNNLALGPSAKIDQPVALGIESPAALSNLSLEQIRALRISYADRHKELLLAPYEPSQFTFGQLKGNLPWTPFRNLGDEKSSNAKAPSKEGLAVANPFLLAFPAWNVKQLWTADTKATNEELMPLPTKVTWSPKDSTMEATYAFSDWLKRYRELGGAAKDSVAQTPIIEDVNAADLGYNWKKVFLRQADGTLKDISSKNFSGDRVGQFLTAMHGGSPNHLCRYNGPCIDDVVIKPNTDVVIKFWKTKPSPDQTADATAIWHIR